MDGQHLQPPRLRLARLLAGYLLANLQGANPGRDGAEVLESLEISKSGLEQRDQKRSSKKASCWVKGFSSFTSASVSHQVGQMQA
jgi:hypothetical protein